MKLPEDRIYTCLWKQNIYFRLRK